MFPGEGVAVAVVIGLGIADLVIRDRLTVVPRQQVAPVDVAMGQVNNIPALFYRMKANSSSTFSSLIYIQHPK